MSRAPWDGCHLPQPLLFTYERKNSERRVGLAKVAGLVRLGSWELWDSLPLHCSTSCEHTQASPSGLGAGKGVLGVLLGISHCCLGRFPEVASSHPSKSELWKKSDIHRPAVNEKNLFKALPESGVWKEGPGCTFPYVLIFCVYIYISFLSLSCIEALLDALFRAWGK